MTPTSKMFRKGDLVETSWGERAIVHSDPRPGDFNLSLRFHKRPGAASWHQIVSPSHVKTIRRVRATLDSLPPVQMGDEL